MLSLQKNKHSWRTLFFMFVHKSLKKAWGIKCINNLLFSAYMYLVFYLDILISSWKKINCPDSIIYYTTYFRGSLAEVFEVVFIIFSKPRGKHFSVYTSLLDKVAQLTFTLAFYKLFQAATLQQKDSSKGFCIFWKIFAISYRTPKSKYFCSF